MSKIEMEKIRGEFERLTIKPTYHEHEPVLTSEEAARTRGIELKQGIKALLFTDAKGNWVIVNIAAHLMVDRKKVATSRGWSKSSIRMATPEEVLDITGCEIGSVPPFGHKTSIPILVDRSVYENTISAFNIGLRTHSVILPTLDMKTVFGDIGAIEGDFKSEK